MKKFSSNYTKNHGQATIEFIVACLVMIPLFFGIYYFARYSDIKQAGIQASRYAAFERAWDPAKIKSDAVIENEVRARFFSEQALIQYHDNPAKAETKDVNLWISADAKKIIENTSNVKLTWDTGNKFTSGPIITQLDTLAAKGFNLPAGEIIKSQITIPLSDIAHFEPLKNINLSLPAAMAIGSGTWNASGSNNGKNSACDRVKGAVVTSIIPSELNTVLDFGMELFERSSPKFGIILPDYVPPGSLRTNNSSSASSTALTNQSRNPCNPDHAKP
jgi:hypothetical protein